MRIVVIMPTYNERKNIGRMVDVLFKEEFPKITRHEMNLLVVDDNSPDRTGEVVRGKMAKYKNLHLLVGQKQGLGYAYIRGMKYAMEELKADAVIEMDADFQHNPADVKRLVKALDGGADVAIGARYVKGGSIPKEWAFYRKLLSWGGNLLARAILFLPNIHDVSTGFRITKTSFLQKIDLDSLLAKESFAYKFHLLFLLNKMSAKIAEVPIAFLPRKREVSKFPAKEALVSLKIVFLLRVWESARFLKFVTVGSIGFIINATALEIFRRMAWSVTIANFFSAAGFPLGVFHQPSAWSAAAAAELAIFSNFNLDNLWTFGDMRITNPLRFIIKFLQFNLTSIGAVIIQFLVIGTGVIFFGDTRTVRLIFLVVAVAFFIVPYNWTMYNVIIWKRWKIPWLRWLQNRI